MFIVHELNNSRQILFSVLFFSLFVPVSHALEPTRISESQTEGMSVSVGLEFDSGDYGTTDTTDTWRIPVGVAYTKDAFFAGANISYIEAESTGTIIINSSRSRMGGVTTTSTTRTKTSGLGDLNLYAGYNFPAIGSGKINYSLSLHLKLPTANENKGLGTGEQDYSIEAGARKTIEKYNLFATLGYQKTGDSPTTNYDDVVYANVGVAMPWEKGKHIGAMVDYSQATTPGFDDALELTGFMNIPLENKRNIYIFALLGLSDGSPDYSIGVNYRFAY